MCYTCTAARYVCHVMAVHPQTCYKWVVTSSECKSFHFRLAHKTILTLPIKVIDEKLDAINWDPARIRTWDFYWSDALALEQRIHGMYCRQEWFSGWHSDFVYIGSILHGECQSWVATKVLFAAASADWLSSSHFQAYVVRTPSGADQKLSPFLIKAIQSVLSAWGSNCEVYLRNCWSLVFPSVGGFAEHAHKIAINYVPRPHIACNMWSGNETTDWTMVGVY